MNFFTTLKKMPQTLAGVCCLFLFCGPVAILAAVIPSSNADYQEHNITHQELWSSWDGLLIVVFGVVMITFSIGLLRRNRKMRFLWPIFFLSMLIYTVLAHPDDMVQQILSSVAWFFITVWYFFRCSSIVQYFDDAT